MHGCTAASLLALTEDLLRWREHDSERQHLFNRDREIVDDIVRRRG